MSDDATPPACRAYDERGPLFEAAVFAAPSADPDKVRADVARALGEARTELPPAVDVTPFAAGRTITVELDPGIALPAAVSALRDAAKAAAGPARFVVELDTPDGPDASPTGARVVLDTRDDAVVARVAAGLAAVPGAGGAGEPNATVELVGTDRTALAAAAPELYRRLTERGILVTRLGTAERVAAVPRVDRDLATKLGASTAEVDVALEALQGKVVSVKGADGRSTPVVLRLSGALDQVFVRAGATRVPLSAFVTMTQDRAPRALLREDQMPAVGARVRAGDVAALENVFEPPPGMRLRVVVE